MKIQTLVLSLLLSTQSVFAEDWTVLLGKLDRMTDSVTVQKKKAICCNNLAIEAYQRNEFSIAESWIEKAIAHDSAGGYETTYATMLMDQAVVSYQDVASREFTGDTHKQAKELAERALTYDQDRVDAYVLIGDIEFENENLDAAQSAWENGQRIDPESDALTSRLAKVEQERNAERKLVEVVNSYFDVRYEDKNISQDIVSGLRRSMDTARNVVGGEFGFRPKRKIIVNVHSPASFAKLRTGLHWGGGAYDGIIRLRLDSQGDVKQTVAAFFHEYTHAIIHDLSRGKCPRWLNEGLARVQESKVEKPDVTVLRQAIKSGRLVPTNALDKVMSSSNKNIVDLGYQQSYSLASYMVKKFGYGRIRALLVAVGRGTPFEVALRKNLRMSSRKLESKWKATLSSRTAIKVEG